MVYDAMKKQELKTRLRSKYVFLNPDDEPIEIETLRKNAWTKGLTKAGLDYRPVIQTRHTFATMMISAGENLGWVQKMMGHASLKMICHGWSFQSCFSGWRVERNSAIANVYMLFISDTFTDKFRYLGHEAWCEGEQILFLHPEYDASGWQQVPGGIWEEG